MKIKVRCDDEDCAIVTIRLEYIRDYRIPLPERHRQLVEAATGDAPEPEDTAFGRFAPEFDTWLDGPVRLEVMVLQEHGEDFAKLPEDEQRMYLLIAAEVLYGPARDLHLLAEAVRDANEPNPT